MKPQTTKHFLGNTKCECDICLPEYAGIGRQETTKHAGEKRFKQALMFADNVLKLQDPRTFIANYWLEMEHRLKKSARYP